MQEAADVIEPFMDSSRKIFFTADDMAMLVKRDLQHGGIVTLDSLRPETVNAIRDLKPGAFFVHHEIRIDTIDAKRKKPAVIADCRQHLAPFRRNAHRPMFGRSGWLVPTAWFSSASTG